MSLRPMPMPVTVVVSRRAKSSTATELVGWAERLCGDASRFSGYLGSKVQPVPDGRAVDVVIGVSFADVESLVRWEQSAERSCYLDSGMELTEGTPTTLSIDSLDGRLWASQGRQSTVTLPRWLSAALVWVGLFPPAVALNLLLGPYLVDWPVFFRTLLTSLVLVPVVVYVTVPALHRAVGPLLSRRRARRTHGTASPQNHPGDAEQDQ